MKKYKISMALLNNKCVKTEFFTITATYKFIRMLKKLIKSSDLYLAFYIREISGE